MAKKFESPFAKKVRAEAKHRRDRTLWQESKPKFPRWYLLACKIPYRWSPRFLDDMMADCYNDMWVAYHEWAEDRP